MKRKESLKQITEFYFAWSMVLWIGMLIFYHIEGFHASTSGSIVLISYLTICLHHSIQTITLVLKVAYQAWTKSRGTRKVPHSHKISALWKTRNST